MRRVVDYWPSRAHESFAESFSNYDVIDSRIDVAAQKALIRMKGNPATSADAAAMLAAVKSRQLAGIYGDDLRAAAQLAARLGTVRWELVPRGQVAILIKEPNPAAPPTIIFREQFRSNPSQLDPALLAAWRRFRLSTPSTIDRQLVYHPRFGYGWLMRTGSVQAEAAREAYRAPTRRTSGEAEILGGSDDRLVVTDTTEIPFRFVCSLDLLIAHPTDPRLTFLLRGSGTLISNRHVLTAAHNLLDNFSRLGLPNARTRTNQIFAAPGRNGRTLPFGRSEAAIMRVSPEWEVAADSQFDFALLTLRDPLGAANQSLLGNRPLGFWSHPQRGSGTHLRPLKTKVLGNLPVNLSGYPSDKCLDQPPNRPATSAEITACTGTVPGSPVLTDLGSMQWRSFGNIVEAAPATEPLSITYDLDSATGQSGGPIWLRWQQFRNLVAVNNGGFPRPTAPFDIIANMGVRITEPVLKQLRAWMSADGVSATF